MAEPDEVDGYPLRRSWGELHDHAVARGRRLRRRRRAARALPVAVVVVVAAGLVAAGALRDEPHRVTTGPAADDELDRLPPLAFAREYDGSAGGSAIFVVRADGTGLRRLTEDPAWGEGAPAWSPDGRSIAFSSRRDNALLAAGRTVQDVYVMRPDGTGVRRVTATNDPGAGHGSSHPTWSPDGDRLAIQSEDTSQVSRIVVLRPDGSGATPITEGAGDIFPAWSPDGRWIAFLRLGNEVWVVRPDGTDARRLATSTHPTFLSWTPDGRAVDLRRRPPSRLRPARGGRPERAVRRARGLRHRRHLGRRRAPCSPTRRTPTGPIGSTSSPTAGPPARAGRSPRAWSSPSPAAPSCAGSPGRRRARAT